MTVITENPAREAWRKLGAALPRPRAILVISAHWETMGLTHVTGEAQPRTIHDFRGFPPELYAMTYPAPGAPALAARVVELLGPDRARTDGDWGFDHGVWGVTQPMYPEADIPTIAVSLDRSLDRDGAVAVGRALAPLRDEGVLIIGSGNVIHNLTIWRAVAGTQPDWATEFQARSNAAIVSADLDALTRFAPDDEAARLAINSGEHYLPLLVALGARRPDDSIGLFNDTLDGALSMTSALIGDTRLLNSIA